MCILATGADVQVCFCYRSVVQYHVWSIIDRVHTTNIVKTRLSCLVSGVNIAGDSLQQFSVVLNILETASPICSVNVFANKSCSHHISRLDKTAKKLNVFSFKIYCRRQSWLVTKFSSHSRHGQDKTRQSCVNHGVNYGHNDYHRIFTSCLQFVQSLPWIRQLRLPNFVKDCNVKMCWLGNMITIH